jgi:hypothetical protein
VLNLVCVFLARECKQCLHRDFRLGQVTQRDSARSRRTKEGLQNACADGGKLEEVAQLLALGLSRLLARCASAHKGADTAGQSARTERVSGPENGE